MSEQAELPAPDEITWSFDPTKNRSKTKLPRRSGIGGTCVLPEGPNKQWLWRVYSHQWKVDSGWSDTRELAQADAETAMREWRHDHPDRERPHEVDGDWVNRACKLLKRREFSGEGDGCPECGSYMEPHNEGCELAALLRDFRETR